MDLGKAPSALNLAVGARVVATGGTVTNYTLGGTNYRAHIFTAVGSTSITFTVGGAVEYLVIGGGGGGGGGGNKADETALGGGGGGAGGYRCSVSGEKSGGNTVAETPLSVNATTYAIYVGAGGAAGINGTTSVFHTVISQGGGAGGKWDGTNAKGFDGACGGGGTCHLSSRINTSGSGMPDQGFGGGASVSGGVDCGGGGGGVGQIGQNGTGNAGGAGGIGIVSFITGQYVQRGGGGGGGGGSGPGGAGGAGGGGQYVDGGAGGSGIVIVRYATSGGATK